MNGRDPAILRGDPITGERYHSREFARAEWDHLWTKIWHVGGRLRELAEPGDFVVHHFMSESVICVRQDDGSIRAFYNVCGHRGQRLTWVNGHAAQGFRCPYHGWHWARDGRLIHAQDRTDFRRGDPCGKVTLWELRCDTWGGFVWYTMAKEGPTLREYLHPIPEVYQNYPMESAVRVYAMRLYLNTNWKFVTDNFSESYHTRTAHPQVPPWIDQDVDSARLEVYPNGHGRTTQPMRPSLTDRLPEGTPLRLDADLRDWGLDPTVYPDFETKVMQGFIDLIRAKRKRWKERGHLHYEKMTEQELGEAPHTILFPNVTLSFAPDYLIFYRSEPHPEDPNRCTFDLWCMVYPVAGQAIVDSVMAGPQPLREVDEVIERHFDNGRGLPEMEGQIVFQDMMLAEGQQLGMKSRGYEDAYLADQETRVRFFHEILNDYLQGRK